MGKKNVEESVARILFFELALRGPASESWRIDMAFNQLLSLTELAISES